MNELRTEIATIAERVTSLTVTDLPLVPLVGKSKLPRVPAIYFALSVSNEVLYIGRTTSLYQRWARHHRAAQLRKFRDVRIAWLQAAECDLDDLETGFIIRFDPPLNGSMVALKPAVPPNSLPAKVEPQRVHVHCAECSILGRLGGYDVIYCTAHDWVQMFLQRGAERLVGNEIDLILGGVYPFTMRIDLPTEDSFQEELQYEDFHELP